MSLDRDESSLKNKAMQFSMSTEWSRQWDEYTNFCHILRKRAISAFSVSDDTISLDDSEQNFVIKFKEHYDWIAREGYGHIDGMQHLELNVVRKWFLSLNRKSNYDWHIKRAEENIDNYNERRKALAEYSEHLELPEVELPPPRPFLMTPFIKETYEVVSKWLDDRKCFESNVIKMLPAKIIMFSQNRRRMIVGNNPDKTEPPNVTIKTAYDATSLFEDLEDIGKKYDIQSLFEKAMASIEGVKSTFKFE